jgi:hypothetical protein
MSLDSYRDALIRCIREGRLNHVSREDLEEKNHLAVGKISHDVVIQLLDSTKKSQYEREMHHQLPRTEVHKFQPIDGDGVRWYIKAYFRKGVAWLESCHPSTRKNT